MFAPTKVLLASHGTDGANAAVRAAFDLCAPHGLLCHLTVIPDFWKGMMGDDWLNNASTRDDYAKYLESELAREIRQHQCALRSAAEARGLRYEAAVRLGNPAACLVEYSGAVRADIIVMGSPRPRGTAGLRSRMQVERLLGALNTPLLIVPHPGRA